MYWCPSDHRIVRGRDAWHRKNWNRCSFEDPFDNSDGGAASCAAEDVVGEGRNFEQCVNGSEKRNKEDWKPCDKLYGRESARRRQAEGTQHQVSEDKNNGRGDALADRILNRTAGPHPEDRIQHPNAEEPHDHGTV